MKLFHKNGLRFLKDFNRRIGLENLRLCFTPGPSICLSVVVEGETFLLFPNCVMRTDNLWNLKILMKNLGH